MSIVRHTKISLSYQSVMNITKVLLVRVSNFFPNVFIQHVSKEIRDNIDLNLST